MQEDRQLYGSPMGPYEEHGGQGHLPLQSRRETGREQASDFILDSDRWQGHKANKSVLIDGGNDPRDL